jgi:outer membrane protein insertion porin family
MRSNWIFILSCSLLMFSVALGADNEKPKHAKIKISGYGLVGNYELKRILKTLELGRTKPEFFDESFVEDATLLLSARIRRDGYLKPRINVRLLLDSGKTIETDAEIMVDHPLTAGLKIRRADFVVHKGVLFYFQKLELEGLESLTELQARTHFVETGSLLRLKSTRIYTPERLKQGLAGLVDVLNRRGYESAKAEAEELAVDDKTGAVKVRIKVEAGVQSLVRSVREEYSYAGVAHPEKTRTVFIGKPYSRVWLQDFTQSLKTNEFHSGYPDTTVESQLLTREELPGPIGASVLPGRSRISEAGKTNIQIDLLMKIVCGDQIHISGVEFKGQSRTRLSLLSRRARVKRGELLDRIKVEEGRYRIAQIGAFESVDLNYSDTTNGTRQVIYNIKEGKVLDFSVLAGYGSYEMLRAGFEAEAHNIWGLGHEIRLKGIQSFKATSGDFIYTVPETLGSDIDTFANASGLRREEISFTRLEYGGGFGGHKFFQQVGTDLRIRYNYQILDANQAYGYTATEGRTNATVGSIITELKFDRRDNPLYPTKGHKLFMNFEVATKYLGGDVNYVRPEFFAAWHHPLGGGRVLSLGASHGFVVALGSVDQNLPFNRRFFPGGENSIRGYTEGEASPRNEFGQFAGAETYALGSVELEQALTPQWSLVAFSDSLGMARSIQHYPFDTGLFSVGGGIRWKTVVGPVRLEYGYNLNRRVDDPTGTLQFSLGFPF